MNSNEIKDIIAYFKKVVRNMDRKELGKYIEIEDFEELSDEIENLCYTEDKHFCNSLLGWIELVENIDLHTALKNLSVEEQTLISYLYHKNKTRDELAKYYNVTRRAINKKVANIIGKIKELLCKK